MTKTEIICQALVDNADALLYSARYYAGANAEDLYQDTAVAALQRLRSFRNQTNTLGWLRAVMRSVFLDQLRREKRRKHESYDEDIGSAADETNLDTKIDLSDMLATLSPQRRLLMELRAEGLPYAEIARECHLPKGTVMSGLSRAKAQLRETYGDWN